MIIVQKDGHNAAARLLLPLKPAPLMARYGIAVLCCAAAFALRLMLEPLLKEHSPLIVFALAVAVSSIRGGLGPGLVCAALSCLGAQYFIPPGGHVFLIAPEYRLTAGFQVAVFLAVSVLLSWLGSEVRGSRFRALAMARRESQIAEERNQILESIPDGFLSLDGNWRVVYVSSAAKRVAGMGRESTGKTVWERFAGWRGTVVEARFQEALELGTPVRFEYSPPGSGRWIEFHAHAKQDGGLTIYFSDITERKAAELDLRKALAERDAALANVRLLRGLLPICAGCKKIRDQQGSWRQMEEYISNHSEAQFSHGLCPDCAQRFLAELENI